MVDKESVEIKPSLDIEGGSIKRLLTKCRQNAPKYFKNWTGHDIKCLTSFGNFVELMFHPTDAASISVCRMLFGVMMLLDIPEERNGANLDLRWGEPRYCKFPLFPFLAPLSMTKMGLVYAVMWLGAVGITLGYKFRVSTLMFVVPYWYLFLLDKSLWNNHSYLYGLCGILFLVSSANRFCSIDSWNNPKMPKTVPFWNYFILKFQFFILYFVAGIKKTSIEWLSGYAMTNLSAHWVFTPFTYFLGTQMTDLLIVHWFICFFDTSVAFFFIYEPTRIIASIFAAAFHLMNSRLFSIGMFPWVCLAEMPLFYKNDWPRTFFKKFIFFKKTDTKKEQYNVENVKYISHDLSSTLTKQQSEDGNAIVRHRKLTEACFPDKNFEPDKEESKKLKPSKKQKTITVWILVYCLLQLFLPFSHFITKGFNNWTNGVYGYSWDMMVHAFDTVLISVKVVDNGNNEIHYLDPLAFAENDRWTKHSDMAYQYAHCIENILLQDFNSNKKTILSSKNFSIYFDIWTSMNGRFQQRTFDPNVDILKAKWSLFEETAWSLPLLNEYSHMRPKLSNIAKDVIQWSNYSDVMFIADFPNFLMTNFISPDLTNVTLTVLQGSVKYQEEHSNETTTVHADESVSVKAGVFHNVMTISSIPSCYMYTFINKTMETLEELPEQHNSPMLPLDDEFLKRVENYVSFFELITNSILFEFYGVPMPWRQRQL